ncbi:hypothetical protein V2J56_02775 [Georgenia sp. MJ206]|uniref:hypothetical protein n=1 Tax=Georgenia wangjunii TaxID=3117730 RepID=UPI002F268AD0
MTSETCVSWAEFPDARARSDASTIVVEAIAHERVGERSMFGAQASVWDVEVTAARKGDVEVGDRLEVASTPVTCSAATYPEGDPLDTDVGLVLYLDDTDFAVEGTERGLALITPLDGVQPLGTTRGEAATWALSDPAAVSAGSVSIDIGVTRLACASGVTGEVLEPQVTYEADRVVVEVDVAPLGGSATSIHTCQGNDVVPVRVELDEPIGDRQLVDGACLAGLAIDTAFCLDAARWP